MCAQINLDTLVSKCLHRPIVKGDKEFLALYKRNDGKFENGTGSSRDNNWLRTAESCYNSPNNVRRIFITYKGVYVHMYKPIVGDRNKALHKFYSFKSVDENIQLQNVLADILSNGNSYDIKNLGLKALKKPWVCSNIEEVYFDWTVLLSSSLSAYGYDRSILKRMLSKGTTAIQDGRILFDLFRRECVYDTEGLKNTFPRLKIIGYIDNLDDVYSKVQQYNSERGEKLGGKTVETFCKLWYQSAIVNAAVKSPNVYVAMHKVPEVKNINDKFVTRAFYSYDVEILERYFSDLQNNMLEYIRKSKGTLVEDKSKENNATKNTEKSKYEIDLDNIMSSMGKEHVLVALRISSRNNPDVFNKLINEMSDEGKEKYMSLLKGE